jgi:hypothetical protein
MVEYVYKQEEKKDEELKYSPKAIGLSNILLFGLGYLFLHTYKRFFIFYTIFVLLTLFLGTIGTIIAYLVVISDSFRLARKIKSGKKKMPKENKKLLVLIIIIIVFTLIVALLPDFPKYYFAYSEESCDTLYPVFGYLDLDAVANRMKCKNMVERGQTLFTFFNS